MPHNTVDPIVLASRIVLALQTVVSRENNPVEPIVVTIGSIHGGTRGNVSHGQRRRGFLGCLLACAATCGRNDHG